MGCCLSTRKDPRPPFPPECYHSVSPPKPNKNRATPPAVEEETVKEVLVLSETPLPKSPPKTAETPIAHQELKTETKGEDATPELTHVSEIYSITESFSTTTTATTATTATTMTEKREDEAISKLQRASRSPAKAARKRPYTGSELGAGFRERAAKSPARRVEPTAGKRAHVGSRPARGRELNKVGTRQRNVGSSGVRRDSGEVSGRRSRSPTTRTTGGMGRVAMGRSPLKASRAANGRSANVAAGVESGTVSKKEESSGVVLEQGKSGNVSKKEESSSGVVSERGSESLENPLVSLECFIFL